ncbi:MAG: hypothetical protein WD354_06720 [Acidimicrobiia bacterium]
MAVALAGGLFTGFWEEISPPARGILAAASLAALFLFITRVRQVTPAAGHRLEILEAVVADETRRPWSPSTLPWVHVTSSEKVVLLVPAADYHLTEVVPISDELSRRGIPNRIAVGESPWERTWRGLNWYDVDVFELPEPGSVVGEVSVALVMKDTGSLAPFVSRCRELGIPIAGKVEGAQDFWDSDTPDDRRPYRNLNLVLCQGEFDADALPDRETAIVGSSRLERMWWSPPVMANEPLAVINLNFVYGVRTADRRLWLESAIEGCELASVPYVISVHPAERVKIASDRATTISASRLLTRASVLISRFSTVPFEAIARGVPFVYHNPHGETVKTFADPMGAFAITNDTSSLSRAIGGDLPRGADLRRASEKFFGSHVDIDVAKPSAQRSSDALLSLIPT